MWLFHWNLVFITSILCSYFVFYFFIYLFMLIVNCHSSMYSDYNCCYEHWQFCMSIKTYFIHTTCCCCGYCFYVKPEPSLHSEMHHYWFLELIQLQTVNKERNISFLPFYNLKDLIRHKEAFVKQKSSSDVKASLWNHLEKKVLLWHREASFF